MFTLLLGQKLLLSLDVSGRDDIENISSLSLLDKQANKAMTLSLKEGKGFYKGKYYSLFIPTIPTFRLQITGFDKQGAEFQRLKTSLFSVGTTQLKQLFAGNESNSIRPGDSIVLKFNLRNTGEADIFNVKATDDLSFTKEVLPESVRVKKNASVDILVRLHAGENASYGDTATVTLSVEANSFDESVSNFIVSYVTVAAKVG